jgi:methyl-accepting chemotaxis protein
LEKWQASDEVKTIDDPEVLLFLSQIIEPHHAIHSKAGVIIGHLDKEETDAALKIFKEEILPTTQEVISLLQKMDGRYDVLLDEHTQEVYQFGMNFERIIMSLIIIALVASFLLTIIITSSIVKPIIKVAGILKTVAEGNLTQNVEIKTKDEIGELSHDFNFYGGKNQKPCRYDKIQNQRANHTSFELSVNMSNTSSAVRQISSNLDNMENLMVKQENGAMEAGRAVGNIKGNIDSLKIMIEQQTDSVNMSSSAIEQMTANIHSVTQTLVENSRNITKLTEASENGKTGVQLVAQEIQEIAHDSEGLWK